jgi:uncharacterized protein (TIGR02266 family)
MSSAPDTPHRAHPRVPLSVEVTLESDHNFYTGITDNISEGGIFVATHHLPAMGSEVSFELVLDGASFHVTGTVCWVRTHVMASADAPEGVGIRWSHLDDATLKAIKRFTRSRDTLFYDHD